jgi:hypothetical protein
MFVFSKVVRVDESNPVKENWKNIMQEEPNVTYIYNLKNG